MNTTKFITIGAAMTLTASLAFAAPHQGAHGGRHGRAARAVIGHHMADRLNLTDAQREQIRTLRSSFREQNREFFESSRAVRKEFRQATRANDTRKVEQLKPAMAAQRTQFRELRAAHRQQILAVLTPEQRAQFEALKAERAERRGKRGPGRGK